MTTHLDPQGVALAWVALLTFGGTVSVVAPAFTGATTTLHDAWVFLLFTAVYGYAVLKVPNPWPLLDGGEAP